MSLIKWTPNNCCGTTVYHGASGYGTVYYQQRQGSPEGLVVISVADHTAPTDIGSFRHRLLNGLAVSIGERGYRASTVADIVRHARTSKRTFYGQFTSKEECFLELVHADTERLAEQIRTAVQRDADWRVQIRQAVEAFVANIESRQAITLSWIRELPSLGAAARPVQRRGLQLLTGLLIELTGDAGFRRAGVAPLTPPMAVILLGGLRELSAMAVEDEQDVRAIVEPAVEASIALLSSRG